MFFKLLHMEYPSAKRKDYPCYITRLPVELCYEIVVQLAVADLRNMASTSLGFRHVATPLLFRNVHIIAMEDLQQYGLAYKLHRHLR